MYMLIADYIINRGKSLKRTISFLKFISVVILIIIVSFNSLTVLILQSTLTVAYARAKWVLSQDNTLDSTQSFNKHHETVSLCIQWSCCHKRNLSFPSIKVRGSQIRSSV